MWENLKGIRKEKIPSHEKLLEAVDQNSVFQCILGYYPDLRRRYISPFRKDETPGCRFEWKGKYLCFVDNAGFKGKVFYNMFDALMTLRNISFYEACKFIYQNCNVPSLETLVTDKRVHRGIDIRFSYKSYNKNHPLAHIFSKEELEQLFCYWVADYWCTTKNDPELIKNRLFNPKKSNTLAWYFPETNKTKLYFIDQKENRFYGNCNETDLFGEQFLDEMLCTEHKTLIITKSGKDQGLIWLKLGIPCIAVQGETAKCTSKLLYIIKHFEKVIVFFDNDEPGINGANILSEQINVICAGKSSTYCLPVELGKDPTACFESFGIEILQNKIKKLC